MAQVSIGKLSDLYERRFDPEFHAAMQSARRNFNFPTAKLRTLAYFQTGGTPSTDNREYWGGTIPWVSAKDFRQFRFEDSEDHITELAVAEATTRRIDSDAMLMVCRSGILQHALPVMICQKPTAINQDIKAFFPDERLSAEFLAAFFDIFGSQLLPLICKSGATVQSVNTEELMALDIPLPPHPVQRKIVAELDVAYAAKRKADREATALLASIDDMVLDELGIAKLPPRDTSLAARVFTVSLKDVVERRIDAYYYKNSFKKLSQILKGCSCVLFGDLIEEIYNGVDCREYKDSGVPYLKVANIKPGEFDFDDLKYIDQDSIGEKDIALKKGRLLLTRKGTFGNAMALLSDYDYAISSEVFCLSIYNELINLKYLAIFLNSAIGQMLFDQHKIGAIMGSLSQQAVRLIPIPVPPKSVQERIVRRAGEIKAKAKKLKATAAAQLAAAKSRIEADLMEPK